MVIQVGKGSIATEFPSGYKYVPAGDKDGKPVHPQVTADFSGPPPIYNTFSSIIWDEWRTGESDKMAAEPFRLVTKGDGLHLGYTATPVVRESSYNFDYRDDIRIGLNGLNVDRAKLADSSDWTATADWGGEMRATFGQGLPFVYVRRTGDKEAVVDLHAPGNSTNNPVQPLTYTLLGLTGRYDGGATRFNLGVDAGASVGGGSSVRVSYDFNGDGKYDRVETYEWFATDAGVGLEDFTSDGRKLLNSTGEMADMINGSIKVEVWRSNGDADIELATDSARSFIDAPFAGLQQANGKSLGDKLYLQGGAVAAGAASTLTDVLAATSGSDTTKVPVGEGGYTGPGQIWYNKDGVIGVTVNGVSYGIFGPTGATWTYTPTGFRSNLDGKDYFSIAALPDDSVATLMDFRSHAYAFVTDTTSSYKVDKVANALTTTYQVQTQMMESGAGLSSDALIGLRRHQYIASDAPLSNYTYASVKGDMKLLAGGNSFTTKQTLDQMLPILPVVGSAEQRATLQQMVRGEYNAFLAAGGDAAALLNGATDTYYGARALTKYSDLAMIAHQVGDTQARNAFVTAIKDQLETWFDATDGDGTLFYYDKEWATLVGYPASHYSDQKFTDHHFHYGYIIYAAAAVAQFDPAWAAPDQYGGIVNELVQSVANWDRKDPTYDYLATFDPYNGHSWASGTGWNHNQESASEALNFAAAAARWGAVTNQKDIEDVGLYLHSMESAAVEQYWFDVDNAVFPEGYKPDVNGRVFANGADALTWFSAGANHARMINWIPMNASTALFYAENPEWVSASIKALQRETADGGEVWRLPVWQFQALVDPKAALAAYASSADFNAGHGESKAHTLAWLQTMEALGTPEAGVTADSPYVSVFNKNGVRSYVAFNPGTTSTVVTFSDGKQLTVAAGAQLTVKGDGSSTSFNFADPLDGSDPIPPSKFNLLFQHGDVQLLQETVDRTLFVKAGDIPPLVVIRNGKGALPALDVGTTIIAAGRDAAGTVVLLGRSDDGNTYTTLPLNGNMGVVEEQIVRTPKDNTANMEHWFGLDLNGDGITLQGTLRTVGSQGTELTLFVDEGSGIAYFARGQTGNGYVPPLNAIRRFGPGTEPTLLTRDGTSLVDIALDGQGKFWVLDVRPNAGVAYSWNIDASGNWVSEKVIQFSDTEAVTETESLYRYDLNGDGMIGTPRPDATSDTVVARQGELALMVTADGNAYARLENGARLDLVRDGQPVKLNRGAQLWGIGRDDQGRLRVLDGTPGDAKAQQWSWIIDPAGRWAGENAFDASTLAQTEYVYGRDLNLDGVVTPAGETVTTRAAGTFGLLLSAKTDAEPDSAVFTDYQEDLQRMRAHWGVTATSEPVLSMSDNPFSDERHAWNLDARSFWSGDAVHDATQPFNATPTTIARPRDQEGLAGAHALSV